MTLHPFRQGLRDIDPVSRTGRVRSIMPTHIEADGPGMPLGALCSVQARPGSPVDECLAEVVRVDRDGIVLSSLESGLSTFAGALITACAHADAVAVGPAFLGRAIDPLGRPWDDIGPIPTQTVFRPLSGPPFSPLERTSPPEILETGIRAIDGLLTLGKGQRVGVFAASGVGKTSLMNQIARQANADITILCLVGERGREIEAIWNNGLDAEAKARSTLVAATSDQSAAMRVRAAHYALALAEYWRDQGKHVLLLLDSATRLAMAMREIGLASGEPPTVRAYTPSVFSIIPKMVERCGALRSGGAITAIMTVLSENDEVDDPVCEMMKSLLDGHIILSRKLAEQGQFPAIDVTRSISRQASGLVPEALRRQAIKILEWLSLHESARALIDTGLYAKGQNADLDMSIARHPKVLRFLRQGQEERTPLATAMSALNNIAEGRE
jgi:flagellum-specific ATP synthase